MKFLHAAACLLLGAFAVAAVPRAQTLQFATAGGGAVAAPVARGDYLYVATGATVSVWNMHDGAHPQFAGRTAPAAGVIDALAEVGGYLYAAWSRPDSTAGITIYALDAPAQPSVAGEFDDYVTSDFKGPLGLATSGSHVYLGDSQNGLFVLDAAQPLAPAVLGQVEGAYVFDSMAVFGTQLLASGNSFLGGRIVDVIDITDPAAPVLAGSTSLDGTRVLRAALTDGYAIGVGNDIMVYDLHDPANITQIFDAPIDQATGAIRDGDTLYLVGDSGIQVWDFATPSAPALLRTVPAPTFAPDQTALTAFGPLILTHTDRGVLLGTDDPQNPTVAAQFVLPIGVAAKALAFDGDHAYFAEEGYGLASADAHSLDPVGRFDADLPPSLAARDFENLSIDSGRAYLAVWGYGVIITDLADPAAPSELGRFPFFAATAIEAHGDRLYVASTTNGGVFRVLDVADPSQPAELGALLTSKTYDLTVRGDYAYLADGAEFGDGGLRVVDVSDPAQPAVVGQEMSCPYAEALNVSEDGDTTYIACSDGSLHVVDTSDRSAPQSIGSVTLPGIPSLPDYNVAHSVVVSGSIAYVGHEFGVDEVDVSVPTAPVAGARHATAFPVRKLTLAPDGRLFALTQVAGTYVFAPHSDAIFADGFD